jgi:DNA adenine methylase
MIADTTIKRPALRYYGGKWNLAPWIISHFPAHKNYVEPCGGAASVLLQKPRSPLETYNDLDGNVVNFFRVLRDRPDELIRKIRLTPWARAEFEICEIDCEDEVERARRFWCRSVMTVSSMGGGSGWRSIRNTENGQNGIPSWFYASLDHLNATAERLRGVQVDRIDYASALEKYDHADSLIYFDPPYIQSERNSKNEYTFEWTDAQHIEAAALLRECAGYVVVSGYACPLYTELYEAHGWMRSDKESQTNSGGKRIESLWLSPRTVEVLNMPRQATML